MAIRTRCICVLHSIVRSFFSPLSAKGKGKAGGSLAGKKRPSSDKEETSNKADSPDENQGPVTNASDSPVFKSKSKRRRVVLDSDDEEAEGGGGAVRGEDREEGGGDAVRGEDQGGAEEERMETSVSEPSEEKEVSAD